MEDQDLENLSPELDTSLENDVSQIIIPKKRIKSNKSKSPIITTSMLLFPPEERQIRQEKRLQKSKCCLQESWKCYNTKQYTEVNQDHSSSDKATFVQHNTMGVLYDPIQNKRKRFLAKKFKHILDTFSMLRECAITPYIRPKIGDCKMLLSTRTEVLPEIPLDLIGFIISCEDGVFPNLHISLQILLTIAVSIASCERSFSKLKLILSYFRASMGHDRLSDLALISIERETLENIDFDNLIYEFTKVKSRRIPLL